MYIFDTERATFVVISHGFTVNSLRFAWALWGTCRLNRGSEHWWGRHLGVHLALLGFAHDPTALGSPVNAVTWLVNTLGRLGIGMKASAW